MTASADALRTARRRDASMTLLVEAQERPLDPGYAEAAARRRALEERGVRPERGGRAAVLLTVTALVLGLVTTAGVAVLRRPAGAATQARALLERQIETRSAEVTARSARVAELGGEIQGLQGELLASQDPALAQVVTADAVAAAAVPVAGPGLRVVLTDGAGAADGSDPEAAVQDDDLQLVVNGLWAAGAEAVAVNGQRLTGTAAVRSAGSAILVDLVPLVGPYRVEAVGAAGSLEVELARSGAGDHLAALRSLWGIGVDVAQVDRLELPAGGGTRLRVADLPEGIDPVTGQAVAASSTGAPREPGAPGDGDGTPDGGADEGGGDG
ncbi:DUF881 domain-containing protein [Cellulomonas endophytica]|uniref:DUF881 domain-containing protein n=1 Tax=Cellulomonas endophytica TaxID=2494735 RepID=UPI001F0BB510|nr:DUF881 domain-containing protein [Cellulomonas endophytica]